MKFTKRILSVLLMAALLVSCLLLSVSAQDDPFRADGIEDVEDIMEYFTLEDFVADNYDNGVWDTEYYTGTASKIEADPTDESNKVFHVTNINNGYEKSSETDKLVVSYNIYFDPTMTAQYNLDVKTFDDEGKESITYNTIFSINMKSGEQAFKYSVWDSSINNGAGGFVMVNFPDITPTAGVWYKIVIFFNASAGQYNFKISADGGESWTYSAVYSLGNVVRMSKFMLRSTRATRTQKVNLYLDEVEIYCGTFERNPSNKNNITALTLLDLEALYNAESTDLATKVRIAEVLNQLVNNYKFVPNEFTPDLEAVKAVIEKAPEYIAYAFANEFSIRAAAIDKDAGYYERLDYLDGMEYFNAVLPSNEALPTAPGISAFPELQEAVITARAAYLAEIAECEKVASDSEAFIADMYKHYSSEKDNKDYDGYLKNFYEKVSSYVDRDVTYAEAVENVVDFAMADAIREYEEFAAKYVKLDAAATAFINGAEDIAEALSEMAASSEYQEAYENAFEKLYLGYFAAAEVYNGGDIDAELDEKTYARLAELFPVYQNNEAYVLEKVAVCDTFNEIMLRAKTATYYTTIIAHLADAAPYVNQVRTKYAGIADSLALYELLTASIAGSESASEAYITAVNAIADAANFADKKVAVAAALALKADGDVLGIDGVKEANIILSKAAAEIEVLINNSVTLVALVEELSAAESLLSCRATLKQAQIAANNSEETYEGVAEAKETLAALVNQFVEEINTMNAAHVAALEDATNTCGAVVSDAKIYKATDVIDEFVK